MMMIIGTPQMPCECTKFAKWSLNDVQVECIQPVELYGQVKCIRPAEFICAG